MTNFRLASAAISIFLSAGLTVLSAQSAENNSALESSSQLGLDTELKKIAPDNSPGVPKTETSRRSDFSVVYSFGGLSLDDRSVDPDRSRPDAVDRIGVDDVDFVPSPLGRSNFKHEKLDLYDFVGDARGESGIASDRPVWSGTHADTLLQEAAQASSQGGYPAASRAESDCDTGYIPEYGETPRVDDRSPVASPSDTDPELHSRLPQAWVVPPGGVGHASAPYAGARPYYGGTPYDQGYRYDPTYNGSSYSYPGSTYSLDAHHPEGPYGYQTDVRDPFWDGDRIQYRDEAGFSFEAGLSILSRGFKPEDAHLKVGPLYLQAVSAEVGVLYSDYDGPARFRPGEEDGWLAYTSLHLRAAARLSPNLYFVLDGELIYLFGDNELGLRSLGNGSPFAVFAWVGQWGMWDVRIYDELGTYGPHFRLGGDAYERAGRYSFGFLGYGNGRDDFLRDPVIYNRVGIEATRLAGPDWRITVEADHTDYFYIDSDRADDHTSREHFGFSYSADPGAIPFSPYFEYDAYYYSSDRFDHDTHTFYFGGSGRICDRVTVDGRIGYLLHSSDRTRSDSDRFLWSLGFRHQITERTSHGVRFGQDYFYNDFTDDSLVSNYVRYDIDHQVTDRVSAYAFAQWSDDDFLTGRFEGQTFDRSIFGARLTYRATEAVTMSLGYRFERYENNVALTERDREIFDALINARLDRQTTAYLRYQYEETDFFDEDLYVAGVRRYF